MRLVAVPVSFDHRGVDSLFDEVSAGEERTLFDAHRLRWIDPSGMLALLVAGRAASRAGRPVLKLPESPEVVSYLTRMRFFPEAAAIFELAGRLQARRTTFRQSDALLEVTPIDSHQRVRSVVSRVQRRAGEILTSRLRLPPSAVIPFAIVLSEVCQNVVEHAGSGETGWVAVQAYHWARRLGRYAAVISVMDSGMGFRRSLERRHGESRGGGWDDAAALQAAVHKGMSRFPETGRGQGLREVRKQVANWQGMLTVRSGSARLSLGPLWMEHQPMARRPADFPGAQLTIIIPAAREGATA